MPHKIVLTSLALLALGCSSTPSMGHGGVELVYDVAATGADDARATALAESARKVVAARLAAVKLPAVVRVDGRKLRVGLPSGDGATRATEAKALLGIVGVFELREVQDAAFLKDLGKDLDDEAPTKVTRDNWEDMNGKPRGCFMVDSVDEAGARKLFPKDKLPAGVELVQQQSGGTAGEHLLFMALGAPVIGNDLIQSVKPLKDPMSTPMTLIQLTPEGTKKLAEVTERIKGKKLAIVLDGKITSTPIVMATLTGGDVQIPQPDVGDRPEREKNAAMLAAALNAGALPGPMTLTEEHAVSGR